MDPQKYLVCSCRSVFITETGLIDTSETYRNRMKEIPHSAISETGAWMDGYAVRVVSGDRPSRRPLAFDSG